MASRRPMPGPGCCQWNTAAWFVGQVAITGWMLAGAAGLAWEAPEVAVVWLLGFAGANAIGSGLWSLRRRLRPFPAIASGWLACGASGLLALAALRGLRPGLHVTRPAVVDMQDEPWLTPVFLVLMLLGTALIGILEWLARKERTRARVRRRPRVLSSSS